MTKIKIYTEEQVKKAIELAQECEHECGGVYFDYTQTEVIDKLTPIKLPSDEEIEKYFTHDLIFGVYRVDYNKVEGAKWMRDKIQGGNNEQQ